MEDNKNKGWTSEIISYSGDTEKICGGRAPVYVCGFDPANSNHLPPSFGGSYIPDGTILYGEGGPKPWEQHIFLGGELIAIPFLPDYNFSTLTNINQTTPITMNAKEAKALALQTQQTSQNSEINAALETINVEATAGKLSKTFATNLSDVVVTALKEAGFAVFQHTIMEELQLASPSTTVSWADAAPTGFFAKLWALLSGK